MPPVRAESSGPLTAGGCGALAEGIRRRWYDHFANQGPANSGGGLLSSPIRGEQEVRPLPLPGLLGCVGATAWVEVAMNCKLPQDNGIGRRRLTTKLGVPGRAGTDDSPPSAGSVQYSFLRLK
jgi:hypothetical protein